MREFEIITNSVNINDVAHTYGLNVSHNGMCNCPFHQEKTASMKLYQKDNNFHCFSCGKHGDVIDLTAKLTGLDLFEAAKRLNSDFGLNVGFENDKDINQVKQYQNEYKMKLAKQLKEKEWLNSAFLVMSNYMSILKGWENEYRPKARDEPMNSLFLEALQEKSTVENLCEILAIGIDDEKHDLYINSQDKIKQYALRLKVILDTGLHKSQNQSISQTKKKEMKEVKNYARR